MTFSIWGLFTALTIGFLLGLLTAKDLSNSNNDER